MFLLDVLHDCISCVSKCNSSCLYNSGLFSWTRVKKNLPQVSMKIFSIENGNLMKRQSFKGCRPISGWTNKKEKIKQLNAPRNGRVWNNLKEIRRAAQHNRATANWSWLGTAACLWGVNLPSHQSGRVIGKTKQWGGLLIWVGVHASWCLLLSCTSCPPSWLIEIELYNVYCARWGRDETPLQAALSCKTVYTF